MLNTRERKKIKLQEIYGNVDIDIESIKIPSTISISEYAQARIDEIERLLKQQKIHSIGKSPHQTIPRHLRRRSMTHNPHLLPQSIRSNSLNEKIAKKRRRKRKRQKLKEKLKINHKNGNWLGTHLWHAKRMFMANIWGHKIPITPTEKSSKFLLKSSWKESVIFDYSFSKCFSIKFKTRKNENFEENFDFFEKLAKNSNFLIKKIFKTFLSEKDFFHFENFLKNNVKNENTTEFFHGEIRKNSVLSPFDCYWLNFKKFNQKNKIYRIFYIWLHCDAFDYFLNIITNYLFNLESNFLQNVNFIDENCEQKLNFNSDLDIKNSAILNKTIYFDNKLAIKIKLKSKKFCYSKFRLIGQKASSVISSLIKPNDKTNLVDFLNLKTKDAIFKKSESNGAICSFMAKFPLKFSRNGVSLKKVVSDFNSSQNNKNNKFDLNFEKQEKNEKKENDFEIKKEIKKGKNAINYEKEQKITILARKTPNSNLFKNSESLIFDIIFDGELGREWWLLFVYKNVRAVGLKNMFEIELENNIKSFPVDFIESKNAINFYENFYINNKNKNDSKLNLSQNLNKKILKKSKMEQNFSNFYQILKLSEINTFIEPIRLRLKKGNPPPFCHIMSVKLDLLPEKDLKHLTKNKFLKIENIENNKNFKLLGFTSRKINSIKNGCVIFCGFALNICFNDKKSGEEFLIFNQKSKNGYVVEIDYFGRK